MKILKSDYRQNRVKSAIYNPKEFRSIKEHNWASAPGLDTPRPSHRWPIFLLLLILIIGGCFFGASLNDAPAMPLPATGEIDRNFQESPNTTYAPFRIIATTSSMNYLVKLEDWKSGSSVLTVFVRRGDEVTVKVPIGIYRAKYAYGNSWHGPHELFGGETMIARVTLPLPFTSEPNQVIGKVINLSPSIAGNLPISKDWKSNF